MPTEAFQVTDTNPNDVCGGGGCVCSPSKVSDCKGPFVVFPYNDMESTLSPHVVIGAQCLKAAAKAIEGEVLSAGEQSPVDAAVDSDAELLVTDEVKQRFNAVLEDNGMPALDADVPEV